MASLGNPIHPRMNFLVTMGAPRKDPFAHQDARIKTLKTQDPSAHQDARITTLETQVQALLKENAKLKQRLNKIEEAQEAKIPTHRSERD